MIYGLNTIRRGMRLARVVDEWGAWYESTPGSHVGFLEQQNSLRDALVAAMHFHIFQKHADRVTMANIAQMVNVLQAMILTDKEKMMLTPTYHVFEMFKVHQDATVLPLELKTDDYAFGAEKIPDVSASASRDKAGKIHISLVNTKPDETVTVSCELAGKTAAAKVVTGRVLTAPAINSIHNFATPDTVKPVDFSGAKLTGETMTVTLPARSVVMLESLY